MFATWHDFKDEILGEGAQTYPQDVTDIPKGPQGCVVRVEVKEWEEWGWFISDEWVEPAGHCFAYGDAPTREQAITEADNALKAIRTA